MTGSHDERALKRTHTNPPKTIQFDCCTVLHAPLTLSIVIRNGTIYAARLQAQSRRPGLAEHDAGSLGKHVGDQQPHRSACRYRPPVSFGQQSGQQHGTGRAWKGWGWVAVERIRESAVPEEVRYRVGVLLIRILTDFQGSRDSSTRRPVTTDLGTTYYWQRPLDSTARNNSRVSRKRQLPRLRRGPSDCRLYLSFYS